MDLTASADSQGGGYVVYGFEAGEWLNYTINVASSGNYSVQLRLANDIWPTAAFHLEVDGVKATGSLLVPVTGRLSAFRWIRTPAIALTAGKHVLKLVSDQQYFQVNRVNIVSVK